MAGTIPNPETLAISVVVPVRNEESSVRALLEGLLQQTLPPTEIVITDGGSTDATTSIIEEFIAKGAPIKLIREKFSMPGRARNIAVRNSSHDWIAFTDAGNRAERDWLAKLARKVAGDATLDVVYGTYDPVIQNFFEECASIAYVPPPFQADGGFVRPVSIVSALMRRGVWEAAGGFPEELRSAEDILFMRNVERAGFRIAREPAAVVHWNIQPSLCRTFVRFDTYARNNLRAGLWREWQRAIFMRYALILVSAIPSFFVGAWWLGVPAGLWVALMIARACTAILRNRANYPAGPLRNAGRLLLLVPILTVIDAAAIAGSIRWLLSDKLNFGARKP